MRRSRNRPVLIALYLNAALMGAVLVAVLSRGSGPAFLSAAYGAPLSPQPIAGGANLYLMPAQFSQNTWGCYILDIDTQTLAAYRYRPTNDGSDLQLVAARKVSWDRKLTHFNTSPSPDEVRKLVESAAAGIRGQVDATTAPNTASNTTTEKTPGTPN